MRCETATGRIDRLHLLMAKRILITGACGFVGRILVESFLKHSDPGTLEVVALDNFSRPGSWVNREPLLHMGVRLIHGDIRMPSDLESVGKIDWVIDAAANPSVLAGVDGKASSRQLVENNFLGTLNLLELCRLHRAGFTLLSTSRVYSIPGLATLPVKVSSGTYQIDAEGDLPFGVGRAGITENYSTAPPVSLYGSTKVGSEHLALEYGYTYDFPVRINRCGVLAGAGQFGRADQGIFSFWLHSWRAGAPLRYIGFDGKGHQVRDCLHPRDVAPLLLKQIRQPERGRGVVVNLSGGIASARSLAQLSEWCADRWGHRPVESSNASRPFDLPWVVLDAGLAGAVWDWTPETPVEKILEEIARFAEGNPRWLDLSSS